MDYQRGRGGRGQSSRGGDRGRGSGDRGRGDGSRGGGGYAPRGQPYQQRDNRGPPDRGGGGRGGGGASSPLTWITKLLPCELAPKKIQPIGWKHPTELPKADNEVKALMPKLSQGKLRQLGPKGSIEAETNHFLMNINPPKELFRYEVDFKLERPKRDPLLQKKVSSPQKKIPVPTPSGDGPAPTPERKVNRDIIKKIMQLLVARLRQQWQEKKKPKQIGIISDFSRILISTDQLEPIVPLVHRIAHSDLYGEDQDDCTYEVTLNYAQFTVDFDRVRELLNEQRISDHPELYEIKQVYNILMKNLGNTQYVSKGRSSLLKISEPHMDNYLGWGLMNWKGIAAICTLGATWKPFINIDIHNSVFMIGQNVVDTISEIFARSSFNNPVDIFNKNGDIKKASDVRSWQKRDFDDVNLVLKSCKVRRKVKGLNRDKVVTGISRDPASNLKFDFNGRSITVAAYFEREVGIRLKFPNGPVLKLGTALVPAEVCTIKEGQSINRILVKEPQKKMLEKCTELPQSKHNSIHAAIKDLKIHENEILKKFGVTLPSMEMLQLKNTRVLAPPDLCYGKGTQPQNAMKRGVITPSDGKWEMWNHSLEFYTPVNIDCWAIVGVGLRSQLEPENFIKTIKNAGQDRGMRFSDPIEAFSIRGAYEHEDSVLELQKIFSGLKTKFGDKKKCFILCVIPQKPNFQYSQVKQAAERENKAEVMTQCISEKNFSTANHSVVKNVLLKINAKLGGVNHVPIFPEQSLCNISILSVPTLIIGIDVTHVSVPIKGRPTGFPSFASVTGSLDRTGMPYMMHIQAQIRLAEKAIGAAEVVTNLDVIVKKMLIEFKTKARCQPARIIVFRDGVGNTQFPEILQVEMQAIRRACTNLSAAYKPPITFLAVQKRHNVRFFLKDGNRISRENVPPGTVVDTEIVQKSDFYLLSHKGMLGTSRPTHYHVLWDDSDFSSDELQGLSYFLCFMYSRCNRSVSYPAPTYYAHWAALRAKVYSEGSSDDWEGDQASLNRLNNRLKRSALFMGSEGVNAEFPMHFI